MNITIEPIDGGRTRMTIENVFPDVSTMEQLLAMGQEEGMTEAVGQYDANPRRGLDADRRPLSDHRREPMSDAPDPREAALRDLGRPPWTHRLVETEIPQVAHVVRRHLGRRHDDLRRNLGLHRSDIPRPCAISRARLTAEPAIVGLYR